MTFDRPPRLPSQEAEGQKIRALPLYNPDDQIEVSAEGIEETGYTDAELYSIAVERTRALRNMDPERSSIRPALGGDGLKWAFEHMETEVGRAFDAHGIGQKLDPILELDRILQKGIDKDRFLYTTAFLVQAEAGAAIGADHPFTEGGIVLVSEPTKRLAEGIKYVVVGEEYSRCTDLLKRRYPQVTIVPWHEAPKVLGAGL